ncbi:complement C1q tumor necrosis factor-related protein 3-like [Lampris incognitus]|uniref:complement C1q tumor necrosis factor-related protein 3-like n=1 Tax=Lampris incognitus TaxID=2546036 RepID=UPI0024B5AA02|nr:complement C1q tumor necrosis factor-related protein 3-like [Lampris incognitus]
MGFRALLLLAILGCQWGAGILQRRDDANIYEEQKELTAKIELLSCLEAKLNDTEKWRNDLNVLETRLNATIEELERQRAETNRLKEANEAMHDRMNATEEEIEKLKPNGGKAHPQVAFSVSLEESGEILKGPSTDTTLVFKRVFSNTGNGYDQITGVFTAPVNGLYYFTFSTYGYNTHLTGAFLMKNGVRQVSTYDHHSSDHSDSSSNAVVLHLVAGDKVSVELWEDARVYDNLNGHTTFTGFLLFPE